MAKLPSLLSEVRYGAFLTYSPRGSSEIPKRSRAWRDGIKYDQPPRIAEAVHELAATISSISLLEILGPQVTLVPVPRSAPHLPGVLWPARRAAEELVAHGLAKEVLPCLSRQTRVPKSAFAAPGERPRAQDHLDSMATEPPLDRPRRVTVVDDIVTKGATLLAAASHVRAIFPEAEVRAFALLRTMGLVPEITQIIDPCVGAVRLLASGETDRQP